MYDQGPQIHSFSAFSESSPVQVLEQIGHGMGESRDPVVDDQHILGILGMGHAIACVQHFQPDHLIINPALSKRDLEAYLGRASRIEAGILRDRLDGVPGQFKRELEVLNATCTDNIFLRCQLERLLRLPKRLPKVRQDFFQASWITLHCLLAASRKPWLIRARSTQSNR